MRLLAEEHRNFEYFFTDVAELDICDEQAVMEFVSAHQIDVIVNCAAYTAVDKAEDNVELCDKLNHVAPGYLAKAARSRNGCLVQVSTDYVFDGTAISLIRKKIHRVRIPYMALPNWLVSRKR